MASDTRRRRARAGVRPRRPAVREAAPEPETPVRQTVRERRTAARPSLRERLGRPTAPLLLAALLTIAAGFGIPRVHMDASAGLLADTGSAAYAGQVRFASFFGGDPVVVLVEPAKGQQLLTPDHMVGMAQLEGDLAHQHGVRRVYGPGTLVNTFASTVTQRALDLCGSQGTQAENAAVAAAKAAGKSAQDQTAAGQQAFDGAVRGCAQQLAAQYPTLGVPALNNPGFYQELLLEPSGSVRPFWKPVLPDTKHGLITVRMDPNASVADVQGAERVLRRDTTGPTTRTITTSSGQQVSAPTIAGYLGGTHLTVSGTPVLAADLADAVRSSLVVLLPVALLAMLLISALVLRVRHRLLAVPLAVLAGVWTAGLGALGGLPLTPATLAVLPAVLGLSTDYVLQAVNRLAEEPPGPARERVLRVAAAILPATGTAAAATAAGVLAFAASTVPLVRQFALLMALGVAMSFLAALLAGLPLLLLVEGRWRRPPASPAPSWDLLARAGRLPRPLVAGIALAGLAGWAALPLVRVETDPGRLLAPNAAALQQAEHVQRAVGMTGEIDLVVTGPNVSTPAVVAWMARAEGRASGGGLTPLTGLPQFLTTFNYGQPPDAATAKVILDRLPSYLTQSVASPDDHMARVAFAVSGTTSVAGDQALVARVNAAGQPPAGYHAYPAGLAVLAGSALDRLTADQVRLTLLALGLVLAVLGMAYRRLQPALLAVLPAVVAAGCITGAQYLTHASATPITVLLSGVVIAFATEFGVLWLARYRSERQGGEAPGAASDTASRRVGPAIVASAAALAAGFAVLALSPVPMVRDFGLWCAADLVLATAAVLVLVPPAARGWLR